MRYPQHGLIRRCASRTRQQRTAGSIGAQDCRPAGSVAHPSKSLRLAVPGSAHPAVASHAPPTRFPPAPPGGHHRESRAVEGSLCVVPPAVLDRGEGEPIPVKPTRQRVSRGPTIQAHQGLLKVQQLLGLLPTVSPRSLVVSQVPGEPIHIGHNVVDDGRQAPCGEVGKRHGNDRESQRKQADAQTEQREIAENCLSLGP